MERTAAPGPTTPLAWASLVHDRRRLLSSVSGVAFAVVLMLTELGFFHAIQDSSTLPVDALAADLLLVSPDKDDMNPGKPFPRARLAQARAVEGVEAVAPVWMSRFATWSAHGHAKRDVVRLMAFDPADSVFTLPAVRARQHLLQRPDTALVDRKLRDSYGGLRAGTEGELEGRRMQVVGDFELGPDLQLNVNLLVSEQTFRRTLLSPSYAASHPRTGLAPADPLDRVELGLVRARTDTDLAALADRLRAILPSDVIVVTPAELKRTIHWFWTVNQPVGAVFGLGFVVGFLIGMAICYQVLFTDVIDQLPQFATLKAMGYRDAFLVALAVRRGALLAVFALAVGVPVGLAAYAVLEGLTALAFTLTPARLSAVAVAALLMCVIASLLATRRALRADPADVF